MEFGLLLPHFGEKVSGERILAGAVAAEELGFTSVWTRDHLVFQPIGDIDGTDSSFLDALTVLTAVGQQCPGLTLGTGALVPYRNPLLTARMLTTMASLLGPRLSIGVGGGASDREFATLGMAGVDRTAMMQSQVKIIRALLTEDRVSWHDEFYDFDDVELRPQPSGDAVRFWWCGSTPKAARLAASVCDGFLPGRITLETMKARVATLDAAAEQAGRRRPPIGVMPTTSIGATHTAALETIDVEALCRSANRNRFFVKPAGGQFNTLDDLAGMVLAGDPDEITEQCRRLYAVGVELVVFDCRSGFDRWEEQVALLAKVVAEFRPGR